MDSTNNAAGGRMTDDDSDPWPQDTQKSNLPGLVIAILLLSLHY